MAGEQLPHGVLAYVDDHDQVQHVTTEHVFEGQRSILLGLGSITSSTEVQHLLDCINQWNELKSRGCHQLVATAVDDAFVLKGFRNTHKAPTHVWIKADSRGEFAKSLGAFNPSTGHSKCYAMLVDEGMTIRWKGDNLSGIVDQLKDQLDQLNQQSEDYTAPTKEAEKKVEQQSSSSMSSMSSMSSSSSQVSKDSGAEAKLSSSASASTTTGEKKADREPKAAKEPKAHHPSRAEAQDHDKLELEAEHDPAHSVAARQKQPQRQASHEKHEHQQHQQHQQHHNRAETQDHDKQELMAGHSPAPAMGKPMAATTGGARGAAGARLESR